MQARPIHSFIYSRQSGFTLIEVLVAMFVLSIGLLGLASLQVTALRNDQSAFMRSQATILAYDLADRMRANSAAVTSGFYDPANAATTAACNTTAGCSTQQMAEMDLQEWLGGITTYLPSGQGWVCIDSTPKDGTGSAAPACDGGGTKFVVKVWWDDERDGTARRFETSFQP
ncbi:MAG TPA: type IV pilus modification protein PilV [Gammaproteobacteria bacterium]|mgnify:CR=1 FL=1|nr:type IV pilus modification protein PilV [Gammaproteobacteria bacterium]